MRFFLSGFTALIVPAIIMLSSCVSMQRVETYGDSVTREWENVYRSYMDRIVVLDQTLVTARGFADQERETLEKTRAATKTIIQFEEYAPDEILNDNREFSELNSAYFELRKQEQEFLTMTRNYPELRSNQTFLALTNELSVTDDATADYISRYNGTVDEANAYLTAIPRRLSPRVNQNDQWPRVSIPEEEDVDPYRM